MAVGIHPKRVANYTPAQWDCFLKLLSNPRVSAISEIGFDFTVSNSLWLYQEELFDKILSLGTLGRVLIMHLRGSADDRCSQVANRLALRRLRKACLIHQTNPSAHLLWRHRYGTCLAKGLPSLLLWSLGPGPFL